MKHSTLLRYAAATAALTLSLAACGGAQDDQDTTADSDPAVESTENADASDGGSDSAADSDAESDTDDDSDADSDAESDADDDSTDDADESTDEAKDDADSEGSEAAAGTLTISWDGEDTELTPDIVRCNGEPGTIRNVVIKTRSDLPLVKVTPGEFAMVKMHNQGEPEKSGSTSDITAEDGTVTFDEASIGDAVVDGTVTCLQGSNS